MTTYNPPKKNAAFIMYVALEDQANAGLFKSTPTLAAGDFKVSKDGGALTNLATLPTNTPASSKMVKISLSADEMNADNVTIVCSDASGSQWYDLVINLQTAAYQFDDMDNAPWSNSTRTLTQGAASVTAAVSGSSVTVYRGTTWSISLTGLGDITTYDTIYFSVKEDLGDAEDSAFLRVKDTASGLLRWNQAAPTAATNGTITRDDEAAGNITISVEVAETVSAPLRSSLHYDVKGVDNDGSVVMLSMGLKSFNILGDVTKAVS